MSNSANLNSVPQSVINPAVQASEPIIPASAPVEPAKAPTEAPKKDLDSTRFTQIAKKEAALVKERESFKKELQAFKVQEQEIAKYKEAWKMVNEIAELQKVDEIAAMRKAGFNDANIMNLLSQTQENVSPEERAAKMAKAEVDKYRIEQEAKEKERDRINQESKKLENDRTIAKFKDDIGNVIKLNADKYEYCNYHGDSAKELVYNTISAILEDSNEMISTDEAAQLVEDWYEEQDKAMESLKKRGKYRAPPKAKEPEMTQTQVKPISSTRVEAKDFASNKAPVKTLSNKINSSATSFNTQSLTPEQNKQRVIDKYMASLKR